MIDLRTLAGTTLCLALVACSTDKSEKVADTPISPKDILATMYHLLGIDPHTMIPDRLGRPIPVAGEGKMRSELLG